MSSSFYTTENNEIIRPIDWTVDVPLVNSLAKSRDKHIYTPYKIEDSMMYFDTQAVGYEDFYQDLDIKEMSKMIKNIFAAAIALQEDGWNPSIRKEFIYKKQDHYVLLPVVRSSMEIDMQIHNLVVTILGPVSVENTDKYFSGEVKSIYPSKFSPQVGKLLNITFERANMIADLMEKSKNSKIKEFFLNLELLLRCFAEDYNPDLDTLIGIGKSCLGYKPSPNFNPTEILDRIGYGINYSLYNRTNYRVLKAFYVTYLRNFKLSEYFILNLDIDNNPHEYDPFLSEFIANA